MLTLSLCYGLFGTWKPGTNIALYFVILFILNEGSTSTKCQVPRIMSFFFIDYFSQSNNRYILVVVHCFFCKKFLFG